METKPKTSSRASGTLAPPLDEKAIAEYREKWGFDPPKARVILLPPEYWLENHSDTNSQPPIETSLETAAEPKLKSLGDVGTR
jgi:hypothetical protein